MLFVLWAVSEMSPICKTEADSKEDVYKCFNIKEMKEGEYTIHYTDKPPGGKPGEILVVAVVPLDQSQVLDVILGGPRRDYEPRERLIAAGEIVPIAIFQNPELFVSKTIDSFLDELSGLSDVSRN